MGLTVVGLSISYDTGEGLILFLFDAFHRGEYQVCETGDDVERSG